MEKHPETQNTQQKNEFVPPRHWIGPEELEASYWADPVVMEKRSQEFHDKPIEVLDAIDKIDKAGVNRRDFLTVMGASMAMASFACARRPVQKIIPYVVKPEEITLGVPTWYASTCKETGYGILVKSREGRPIKIEGNPDHPLNNGALSARGQATVLSLYDPDRLKAPLFRNRAIGGSQEISWSDADKRIGEKLKGATKVRILSGEILSESTQRVIREFLGGFGNGAQVVFEPLSLEDVAEGQAQSYGTAVVPSYRFDKADVILSIGADFLGTWNSPVEHANQWSKNRKLDSDQHTQATLSKLVTFEATMTLTGANSDERYPIRPGDELKIALAIAHQIVVADKKSAYSSNSAVVSLLSGYSPEAVASEIGLQGGAETIRKTARELFSARGKGLVVAGGLTARTKNAQALQIAVNFLNSALENEGSTIDGTVAPFSPKSRFADLARLIQDMKGGQVEVLIVYRTNPAYSLPRGLLGLADAMAKVPTVISIGERDDETAQFADFVLPDHHFLENWGDATPRKGLYSIQQPVIAPIHSSRAFEDMLITWAKGAGKGKGLIATAEDWHAYLQANWKETIFKLKPAAGSFEQFWEGTLRLGVFDARSGAKPSVRAFRTAALETLPKYTKAAEGLSLALYSKVSMHDGAMGQPNNAWLQELPDSISSVTWDNYVNVGPALAKKLGLSENDVVELVAGDVRAEIPVHIQPGMHPQTVSVAVGYGRSKVGKVGNGAGVDVYPFVQIVNGTLAFSGQGVTLRKTGRMYRLAAVQWHNASEGRPVINDITLARFKKNPAASNHQDPHLRLDKVPTMWPRHEYKGYRWGMAIDLNSCIGCGACTLACQAENNVPVVGRDRVRVSRQMHWIRIDRYYMGNPENPDVLFQPMLCQHCENAPCETVCPVLATVHDDEGLNVQVYNRCVGTRYCQNNCPYKVRRFNFFDHWKSYEGTMNLAWNPDVTVRTRGIMEKCTFCVQRIRDAKDKAKDLDTKVVDGAFKTACQQTCPTDAIIFGDANDPKSRVSKLRADKRAFKVLEVLNTEPMISYMSKVRNKEAAEHGAGNGHGGGDHSTGHNG